MFKLKVLVRCWLFLICIGPIYIVQAHTDLDRAKSEYNLKLGEYNQAYGYWETAERQIEDLYRDKKILSSEWNSNLEDLGENAIDSFGLRKEDIPDMIKAGIKTVMDLFDGQTLAEKLSEKQAEIDNIAIGIPELERDRDAKKSAMETARDTYRSLQHRCGGCLSLFDNDPAEISGHGALTCAVGHTYYECGGSYAEKLHTTSAFCPVTGTQMLECQISSYSLLCSGCNNTYNPFNSVDLDIHRLRTCYHCNQQYRECDSLSNRYCSYAPNLKHSGY